VERWSAQLDERESDTLNNTTHASRCNALVKLVIGWAMLTVAATAEAQTSYYYGGSASQGSPSGSFGRTYYRRGLFGARLVWAPAQAIYTNQQYSSQPAPISYVPQPAQALEVSPTPISSEPGNPATPAVTDTTAAGSDPAPVEQQADPYGFTAWLNATRAAYGLPAVGYDPNLSSWAAVNNSHQATRGIGHFVMGPARRQNSAMGAFANIGSMWMGSPAHRAALLDPTIRWIGIAGWGAYWTFNAN
jgi:uncharacterized protein YkwD